ncbi:MAG: hypothetical protein H3C31_07805 [Brumimicrobium sp.]|nr:hypothetical protein [Brumimicrobium sp.]MCO5267984.1 hypothetical protein [Brumimicrobium sp.]
MNRTEKGTNLTPDNKGLKEESQPFTIDEMRMRWRQFAHKLKDEGQGNLYTSMLANDPLLVEGNIIKHTVNNNVQKEFLEANLYNILHFLRQELKNTSIEIQIFVEETAESKLFTSKDKFDDMAKRNPDLNNLRNTFKLDIDL